MCIEEQAIIADAMVWVITAIYTQPDKVHMYCTIISMNCALQGRRRLHVEVGRLGSDQGYDKK